MRASTGALWATLATKVGGDFFGPGRCVSVTRSTEGSCVLATNCEGRDLSKFEFAFDCSLPGGGLERHSFGLGGFDAVEEFDTDVHCDLCGAPGVEAQTTPSPRRTTFGKVPAGKPRLPAKQSPGGHAAPVHALAMPTPTLAPKHQIHAMQSRSAQPAESPGLFDDEQPGWYTPPPGPDGGTSDEVVKYGPDGCVSTYRSPEGHCVVATKCAEADISDYEFGLVCVDKVGRPVRHLFGKGSFDPEEVFDTVIPCDQCLGLEDIPDSLMLNNEVIGLSKEIKELKGMMGNITGSVARLNAEVFAPGPAPAPASAPAVAGPAPAAEAAAGFVAQKKQQFEESNADVDTDEDGAAEGEESQDQDVEEQEVSHKHLRHRAQKKHRGHKHQRRHEDLDASDEGADQESTGRHLRKQKRSHHHKRQQEVEQDADEDGAAVEEAEPAEPAEPAETSDPQEEDQNVGDGFDD